MKFLISSVPRFNSLEILLCSEIFSQICEYYLRFAIFVCTGDLLASSGSFENRKFPKFTRQQIQYLHKLVNFEPQKCWLRETPEKGTVNL